MQNYFSRYRYRRCWRIATLLLGLLLLSGAPCRAQSDDRPLLQQGQQSLDRGDYPAAYRALLPLQGSRAGEPNFDFMLGRAAYENGDFETAIFAFERVLIARPDSDRARLELARTFYASGDLETARKYFNAVLERETPQTVRQNIEAFLSRIDQAQKRHLLGGMISLGLSYDDNVYAAPAEETIRTLLGTVVLDGASASPREDLISQATLLLNHAWRADRPGLFWQTSLLSHNAFHRQESPLDLKLLSLTSGPVWNLNRLQVSVQGNFNYLDLDEHRYLSGFGADTELIWAPAPQYSLGGLLHLARLDYADEIRDAGQYGLELKPTLLWGANRLGLELGVEFNDARDNQHSYLRQTLALRLERQLPWQLTCALGYRFQHSGYRKAADLFGSKRRDQLHEVSAGLTRPLWRSRERSRQLLAQLNYSYSNSDSNIDLYQYAKQVTTLSLSWLF